MLMMDYGSHYTGSSLGSDTLSGSMSSRQPSRVRAIRLVRPNLGALSPPGLTCRHGPNLGFSIRGGREHGTGFFVSQVELGSEAHRQGLRIGDQIIRVNGFTIEDAVHKEVLQLISNHTHLSLKVRSVGMIPVKDKRTDPLSWHIISDCNSSTRSSPQLSEKNHDVRISIMVAPRSKLGCGICKGPEWKPGIFIQFTKEGGIAREAGLRPGDQILYCNNVDFGDIPFNDAVNLMKASRQLDLIVRKSAGSELFPGESSGYNSSASSVTGDQSPSWSESKRLSIVKEESLDLEDRLSNLDRFKNLKKWEKIEWDDMENEEKYHYKPTIINLSENGMTIKNNGTIEECHEVDNSQKCSKLADICLVSEQHETKTVVVEVHRTDDEKLKTENKLCKSPSTSSSASTASGSSTQSAATSLSSAISQELLRRSEKNKHHHTPTIDEQLQMKKVMKNVDSEKQQQHSKLMDEFKKAHRRMFKANEGEGEGGEEECENTPAFTDATDRNANREFNQKVSERLSNLTKEAPQEKPLASRQTSSASTTAPPPPPPPPMITLQKNTPLDARPPQLATITRSKQKAPPPPVPIKTSTLSFHQPPPCPTPDYDTLSIISNSTLPRNGLKKVEIKSSHVTPDSVEMDSLESYKINNPANNSPKPPSTYFQKNLQNGSVSSVAAKKTVSVTIGEYPSGTNRRIPGKFDFLQNGADDVDKGREQPISSMLASELAQTLSRSNLRRRTESLENILGGTQIKNESNGSIRICVNNNLNKPSNNNVESLTKALENRVTINIPSNDRKLEPPNGILKNGNGNHSLSSHRPLVHQKSITFGEMPTVIKDPLHVT